MRIYSILCCVLLPVACWGQVHESFSDGDFTSGPQWQGNTNSFKINSDGRLQLDETGSGSVYLGTVSHTTSDATWEFELEMAFNPSSRNLCRVYLISDLKDLSGDLNGYYIRIGGSQDEISLYRQDLKQHTKIIDGVDGFVDTTIVKAVVKVTREQSGKWSLFARSQIQKQFQLMGIVEDNRHQRANFFGFFCQFTSTRSKAFFFDNILVEGESFIDTEPPQILSLRVLDKHRLEILISEPVQALSQNQFRIRNLSAATELHQTAFNTWELKFPVSFKNGEEYTLEATDLKDQAGNISSVSWNFSFWETEAAEEHDLIISEIMADPTPAIQLPPKEYLEIHNRSNKAVNLRGWTIADATKRVTLPEHLVLPGSYLILCPKTNTDQYPDSLNLIELSSWPTLNNLEDLIMLADSTGKIIHFVNYQETWYRSNLKKLGGWSLEIIDVNYPCTGTQNWTASSAASGGTPGKENSVSTDNPDLSPPIIVSTFAPNNKELQITFDQALSLTANAKEEIVIEPSIRIDTFFINSFVEPVITVQLQDSLTEGIIYLIAVTGFTDCNKNVSLNPGPKAPVGLAQSPDSADLVINEILFNPRPLGVRFVELYNRSVKALNIKNWRFARWQLQTLVDFTPLTAKDRMIYPGDYCIFTENIEKLKNQYPASANISMVQVADLPTLGEKQGSIVLVAPSGSIIDALTYHQDMHHPLLIDDNGVSLERASPDMATNDPNNWYSGAEATAYATPGEQNSQQSLKSTDSEFTVDPKIISPLSSRFPSYTRISFKVDQPGNSGSVLIFNGQGYLVKTLVNNSILQANGAFQWDGTNDKDQRVPMGYYIVMFQVTQRHGRLRHWRETVVVAPDF